MGTNSSFFTGVHLDNPPSTLWSADMSHLGQNMWTVAYGQRTKLVYALDERGGLAALDSIDGR